MNIKQQLEAEARNIVEAHRSQGGDIHETIAKHASEKGHRGDVVRSLTWLVNRHAFKQAMAVDRKDEIDIANAEAVLHKMNAPQKEAGLQKSASLSPSPRPNMGFTQAAVSGSAHSGGGEKVDYGPALRKKLAAREMELNGEINGLRAQIRSHLSKMAMLAESVKRIGSQGSDAFREKVASIPEAECEIMRAVLEKVAAKELPLTEGQLKMYLGRALVDLAEMAKTATLCHEAGQQLADRQRRVALVKTQMSDLRSGLEV